MNHILKLFGICLLLFFNSVPVQAQKTVPGSSAQVQLSFAPIVKKAAPAVVNVFSKRVIKRRSSPFLDDPVFRRFFGRNQGLPRARVEKSLGSGVIVSADGIIVTNNHVVKGGTEIQVVLADRREFSARIILADEKTDLAILKVDTSEKNLPFIKFQNSDKLEVGDLVLAIGNPFGVGQTVTSGIVSALARTQVGVTNYQFFIQTDAAINPGNSGGALIDINGELVGINTAIFSRSGGSNGIGFAIPANMVRSVVEAARVGKSVKRPWLGAQLLRLTSELAESFGLSKPVGVLVGNIYPRGPAAEAGLKRGDIILSINGYDVFAPTEFNFRFATLRIGRDVDVKFQRRGKIKTSRIRLISPPQNPPARLTRLKGNHPLSQVKIANLSPAVAEEMQLKTATSRGVVIVDARRTLAGRYGLKRGDIITAVQGIEVTKVNGLVKLMQNSYGFWEITVQRGPKVFNWRIGS